jgi:hypothetical protein
MLDRQKFVQAVHQALREHDDNKEKDKTVECTAGHLIHFHDCDKELEHFADRILELMA